MMKHEPSAGFTLVELLVVIGILGLLMATLLPQVLESKHEADIFADKANLTWHFKNIEMYKNRQFHWPADGGAKFVLAPWVRHVIQHNKENLDRYFTPGTTGRDPRGGQLQDEDPKDVWRDFEDITSHDTSYAGLRFADYRKMRKGDTVIMATDNEFGNTFEDGSINVLLAGGHVRTLYRGEVY